METYVVRVYRHKDENGDEILGMVEIVGENDKKSFSSVDEMVEIITGTEKSKELQKKVKSRSVRA
jgi:hypothetical protein